MLYWIASLWIDGLNVLDNPIPQALCDICNGLASNPCKFYNQQAHHCLIDALSAKVTMVAGAAFKAIL